MFEETAPKRTGAFRDVFVIIIVGFVLLSLPNWLANGGTVFDYPYVQAVYEFFVFLGICLLTFRFLRVYAVEHRYILLDSSLIIRTKMGAKQEIVAEVPLTSSCQLLPLSRCSSFIQERGWKKRKISFGLSDKKTAYLLTFSAKNGDSALIFQPSEKFVAILKQKLLDKQEKI